MLKRSISLFVFSLVVSLAATSPYAQAEEFENGPALLYEISGNGLEKPSYLFGTVHLICPADMMPMEELDSYISATDRLVLEIDFDNPTELQALMALVAPVQAKNLSVHLTKKQFAKIDKMTLSYLGKPFADLKHLNPIVLQSMLLRKGIGCNPPGSYEISFLQAAMMKKKPIEGLETVAEQLEALNKTPTKKQALGIYEIAKDPEKYFRQFKDLIRIYKEQDSVALYELVQNQMKKDPALQVMLLDERNTRWIPKIETMISEKPAFIAVGAAHLGGDNGILKLLDNKGFTLRPIRLSF